ALRDAEGVDHPPRKLLEALLEDFLVAVIADDPGVIGQAVQRGVDGLGRDARRGGLLLELVEPGRELRRILAGLREGRRGRGEAEGEKGGDATHDGSWTIEHVRARSRVEMRETMAGIALLTKTCQAFCDRRSISPRAW